MTEKGLEAIRLNRVPGTVVGQLEYSRLLFEPPLLAATSPPPRGHAQRLGCRLSSGLKSLVDTYAPGVLKSLPTLSLLSTGCCAKYRFSGNVSLNLSL